MRKLVLFDIDGTLVRIEGISRNALIDALRQTYGTEGNAASHSFAGKMDGVIIYEILHECGFKQDDIWQKFEEVKETYISIFRERAQKEHVTVLNGVRELVSQLHKEPDVFLGLLTGNFEASGRHKLALSDLNHFFDFGAFAEDGQVRNDLPEVAVARAHTLTQIHFRDKDVVIICDTEHDVRCAKVFNSRSIAVATGHYSFEQLNSEQPDHTLNDLSQTSEVIELILA
jgi:phosphoglycolate phosphatase-like HAD superfamily hydrolase